MSLNLHEPTHVDEPQLAQGYADMFTRVVSDGETVIVRRGGADAALILPVEYLEVLQDALAMEDAKRIISRLDLPRLAKENPPPQAWFDGDEPKPF
jgi:PHD/YefM family antitoxin component YafN of YafNO toxin-antitoxin module